MLNVDGSSTRFCIALKHRVPLLCTGVHQRRPFCSSGGGTYRRRPNHRSACQRSRRCGAHCAAAARSDGSSSADVAVVGGGAAGLAAAYFAAKQGAQVCARCQPVTIMQLPATPAHVSEIHGDCSSLWLSTARWCAAGDNTGAAGRGRPQNPGQRRHPLVRFTTPFLSKTL